MIVVKSSRSNVEERWWKRILCKGTGFSEEGCGSTLLVLRSDLYLIRIPGKDSKPGFKCCVCGALNSVPERLWMWSQLEYMEEGRQSPKIEVDLAVNRLKQQFEGILRAFRTSDDLDFRLKCFSQACTLVRDLYDAKKISPLQLRYPPSLKSLDVYIESEVLPLLEG